MPSDFEGRDYVGDPAPPPPDVPAQQPDVPTPPSDSPVQQPDAPPPTDAPGPQQSGDQPQENQPKLERLEVPHAQMRDASGHEYNLIGDPEGLKQFDHMQGQNDLGFKGTCGLCSIQDILDQFGAGVSENDIVHFAAAHHLCRTDGDPEDCGGTNTFTQAELLREMHIDATPFHGGTIEQLASSVESGHKIILETNAGELFHGIIEEERCAAAMGPDPHRYNHAVTVTGVVRDSQTGTVVGIYINDTGVAPSGLGAQFIPIDNLQKAWVETGGDGVAASGPVDNAGPAPSQPAASIPDAPVMVVAGDHPAAQQPGTDQAAPQPQADPGTAPTQPQQSSPDTVSPYRQSAPQDAAPQSAAPPLDGASPSVSPPASSQPGAPSPGFSPSPQQPDQGPAQPRPIILPFTIPRPEGSSDSPQAPADNAGVAPIIALPIVAVAALRLRSRLKPKS